MSDRSTFDWDPHSDAARADQIAAYDSMRRHCPVARSDALGWSLFRHADVMRALLAPEVFSNVVSARPSVPNGMDAPEHTEYRRVIEPYFAVDRMAALEPRCRAIAAKLVSEPSGRRDHIHEQLAERATDWQSSAGEHVPVVRIQRVVPDRRNCTARLVSRRDTRAR